MAKTYTINCIRGRTSQVSQSTGTIEELTKYHAYTLEKGASWAHEKGNSKINRTPKTLTSLVNNLNNAVNNTAANGWANETYSVGCAILAV